MGNRFSSNLKRNLSSRSLPEINRATKQVLIDAVIKNVQAEIAKISDYDTFASAKQKEAYIDGAMLFVFILCGGSFPAKFFVNGSVEWVDKVRTTYPFLPVPLMDATEWMLKYFGVTLNAIFNGASYQTVYEIVIKKWLIGAFITCFKRDETKNRSDVNREAFQKGFGFASNVLMTLLGSRGFYISGRLTIPEPIYRALSATSNTFVVSAGVSQVQRLFFRLLSRFYTSFMSEKGIPALPPEPLAVAIADGADADVEEARPLIASSASTHRTQLLRQLVYLELKNIKTRLEHLSTASRPRRFRTIVGYGTPGHVQTKFAKYKSKTDSFVTKNSAEVTLPNLIKDSLDLVDDPELTNFHLRSLLLTVTLPIICTFAAIIGYTLLIAANAIESGGEAADWTLGAVSMIPDYGIVLEFDVGVIMSFFAINALKLSGVSSYMKVYLGMFTFFSLLAISSFGATANATVNGVEKLGGSSETAIEVSLVTAAMTDFVNAFAVERVANLIVKLWGYGRKNHDYIQATQFIEFVEVIRAALERIEQKHTDVTPDECDLIINTVWQERYKEGNHPHANKLRDFNAYIDNEANDFNNLRELLAKAKGSDLSPMEIWLRDSYTPSSVPTPQRRCCGLLSS